MKRVVVHIDKLVLRGIDRHDAAAVAEGVRTELQRRLAAPGAAGALENVHRIEAGEVRVGRARGDAVGVAVAGRIARGLTR